MPARTKIEKMTARRDVEALMRMVNVPQLALQRVALHGAEMSATDFSFR